MTLPKIYKPRQPFPDPVPTIIRFASLNILAGASGVGKTCLMSWILTHFRDGTPLFGHPVAQPTKIAYICADRGWATAVYWLEKAGYPDLPLYSLADDPLFQPYRLRERRMLIAILAECLDRLQLPPGSLVIIDPIALFLGGNPNDYQSVAVACLEIRRLCTSRQLTIWGLAHASKQKADKKDRYDRLQDRILGSSALLGYADTQMYLASPEETGEKYYQFLWHSHTAPGEVFPLGRDAEGMFVPYAESVQSLDEDKILAAISTEEAGSAWGEILIASETSKSTLHRYLQELTKEGRVLKLGHGKYRKAGVN